MTQSSHQDSAEVTARRKRAAKTALIVGGIAVAIYIAFILSGVIGR